MNHSQLCSFGPAEFPLLCRRNPAVSYWCCQSWPQTVHLKWNQTYISRALSKCSGVYGLKVFRVEPRRIDLHRQMQTVIEFQRGLQQVHPMEPSVSQNPLGRSVENNGQTQTSHYWFISLRFCSVYFYMFLKTVGHSIKHFSWSFQNKKTWFKLHPPPVWVWSSWFYTLFFFFFATDSAYIHFSWFICFKY